MLKVVWRRQSAEMKAEAKMNDLAQQAIEEFGIFESKRDKELTKMIIENTKSF